MPLPAGPRALAARRRRERATLQLEALELADRLARPFDLAYAQCFIAMLENLRRDFAAAAKHAGQAIVISQKHGFNIWLGAGTLQLAIAKGGLGQLEEAIPMLGATLAVWQAGGAELSRPYFLAGLAQCHRAAGAITEALAATDEALAHSERYQERYLNAELRRVRAELLAASSAATVEECEAEFHRAIEIARQQGARLLELRATTSLHAFCMEYQRPQDWRDSLEQIARSLALDGLDTSDLREAEALLARS